MNPIPAQRPRLGQCALVSTHEEIQGRFFGRTFVARDHLGCAALIKSSPGCGHTRRSVNAAVPR